LAGTPRETHGNAGEDRVQTMLHFFWQDDLVNVSKSLFDVWL
jgi:hypothetical protein